MKALTNSGDFSKELFVYGNRKEIFDSPVLLIEVTYINDSIVIVFHFRIRDKSSDTWKFSQKDLFVLSFSYIKK